MLSQVDVVIRAGAKVAQLELAIYLQDVLNLDVSVDNLLLVESREGIGNIGSYFQSLC